VSWRFSPSIKGHIDTVFALILGGIIWQIPPAPPLDENGMHFLATLAVAVVFWARESYDEYVVGLMLLLSWVVLGVVPSSVALSGFGKSSWLFVVAALGLGAAVNHTGLLSRVASQILKRVPLSFYRTHLFLILTSGLVSTALLPTGKARTVIGIPMSQAISDSSGFAPRSNGSAALNLAALVGFSQLSFLYLTGGEYCLIGWNLLPGAAKSEFGWTAWFLAALPAGILTLIFVFCALLWLFPLRSEEKQRMANTDPALEIENSKPFSRQEWIALITLLVTITGWLTMPMHGIGETWIAVASLLVFHVTGLLTKEIFTRKLDWGLILFFGIVTSMAGVTSHLKVDRWFITQIEPALTSYALGPLPFLAAVVVLVNIARLFIRKSPVVTFFMITMVPIAHGLGVHPGALLLTIVMASESFFVSYQDGPYQIAYSSTGGQAFSHTQARKLLLAKSAATLLAIAGNVPYWKMLGLIH
jgi:DASS family divalent anion:Na+ symporter